MGRLARLSMLAYRDLGADLVDTADEGLALAAKVEARISQTAGAARDALRRLRTVGVGGWSPTALHGDPRDDGRLETAA